MQRTLLVWYLAAGALLGSAFLHQYLWPLFAAGLVCWCFAIAKKQNLKEAFLGGWISGTIKMLLVLWWFWSTYPLELMNIHPAAVAGVLIGLYWLITAAVIGLGFAATTLFAWWCMQKYRAVVRIVCIPLALVAGEVLGSLLFSVYIIGPGSSLNTYFSFGYLGYLLVDHTVLRYAGQLGTVYILTYIAGVVGISLFESIPKLKKKKKNRFVPATLFGFVFLVSGIMPMPAGELSAQKILVAAVHSEFALEYNPSAISLTKQKRELERAIDLALVHNPAYIILPEATSLSYGSSTAEVAAWFAARAPHSILVDSARIDLDNAQAALRAFIYDPSSGAVYTLDKKYLAPQGEFVPYFYKGLFTLFGAGDFFESRTSSVTYRPAAMFGAAGLPIAIPGVMFCSENLPPFSIFAMKQKRELPFVVHPVSDSWFNSPYVLWNENRQMVALQALFNGLPVLQAGNMAPTLGFDEWGHLMMPEHIQQSGHTEVSLYQL